MNKINRILKVTAATIVLVTNFSAHAEEPTYDFAKVISNLNNIKKPLEIATQKAEKDFRLNGIAASPTPIDLMSSTNNNPYINTFTYNNGNFRVKLKFKTSSPTTLTGTVTDEANSNPNILDSAVDKLLSAKTIVLVPIFAANDQKITAWECITDISSDNPSFLGARSPQASDNGKPSIISELSDSPLISNCRYLEAATISSF